MAEIGTLFSDPERLDQGTWIPYEDDIELRVRAIPDTVRLRLENQYLYAPEAADAAAPQKLTEEGRRANRWVDLQRAQAAYALVDSRNAQWRIAEDDVAQAEIATKWLGRVVAPGELVTLDGHWSDAVKHYILANSGQMVVWIGAKATLLGRSKAEREKALKKT